MTTLKSYAWQVLYALVGEAAMLGGWVVAMGFGVTATDLWWRLLICVGMVVGFAAIYYFLDYVETKLISLLAMAGVGIGCIATLFRGFGGWVEHLTPHGFFQWVGIFIACMVLVSLLGLACSIFLKMAYKHLLHFELFYVIISLLFGVAITHGGIAVLGGAMECSVALFVAVIIAALAGLIAGFSINVKNSRIANENGNTRLINRYFSHDLVNIIEPSENDDSEEAETAEEREEISENNNKDKEEEKSNE